MAALLLLLFPATVAGTARPVFAGSRPEAAVTDKVSPPATEASGAYRADAGFLLDEYPGALAAYSLRKLRSGYSGPAIRVKRMSDGAVKDFSFVGVDLDVAGLEAWLSGSDGAVVKWYSQIAGHPALIAGYNEGPLIAEAGAVLRDSKGHPEMRTGIRNHEGLYTESKLPTPLSSTDAAAFVVVETDGPTDSFADILTFADPNSWPQEDFNIVTNARDRYWFRGPGSGSDWGDPTRFSARWAKSVITAIADARAGEARFYQNDVVLLDGKRPFDAPVAKSNFFVGLHSKSLTAGAAIRVSEIVIYRALPTDEDVWARYDNINTYWEVGPTGTNRQALLPQYAQWQIDLYDWLETITVQDVKLPAGDFTWGSNLASDDELADLWVLVEGLTTSRVVRAEPEWYVLDAGNGKGIEATGAVRIWHGPGPEYHGNPPRSWGNEPAYIYQLSIPGPGGGQGNPYYQLPAMGKRALVVTIVDMMMYHQSMIQGGFATWQDMYGKAFSSWADTYLWCKDLLPPDVQDAFEEGMAQFLDQMIAQGPRGVNTNMDMFSMKGAATFYMATENPTLRARCVQAVKRALFGYADGELGVKHKVFRTGGFDGGVFDPSGFIMEGDQPDVFYGGESIYHLIGALTVVSDRKTGSVPADWEFLVEVVRRLEEWRLYQYFYEPGLSNPKVGGTRAAYEYHAGAGMSGRTGGGVPSGQSDEFWKFMAYADRFDDLRHLVYKREHTSMLPTRSEMVTGINERLAARSAEIDQVYKGTAPEWNGWSPWIKNTPYLPREGWYTRLKALADARDRSTIPPVAQRGTYYSKVFGGYPVGNEYWAYKNTDGSREWGFFMEAQARQGGYNGWYGGKIETFWTEKTGVVLINRHGKSGCDGEIEDSICWENLDYRAAHHVWGRDENGKGFTTLLLRGHELQRTSTFDMNAPRPSVTVTNYFNEPTVNPISSKTGEETGAEIEGALSVANRVEALSNGVRVTHTITSDGTDEITELWASIPVFLRLYSPESPGTQFQIGLDNTSIEYWDGAAWKRMPEDQNGDGKPEIVTTTKLRLGRDFKLGDGPQYVYVGFSGPQRARLSTQIYYDPYQTKASVRTVHFDLHGRPGTAIDFPTELAMSYTIQTTEPGGTDPGPGVQSQVVQLAPGWNLVSRSVEPADPSIAVVLKDVAANVVLVKDNAGQVYSPRHGITDLSTWSARQAYAVFVDNPVTLTLTGTRLSPQAVSIPLEAGWNMVPYIPDVALPLEQALAPILPNVTRVEDAGGAVYDPAEGVNTIGQMVPGRGYRVHMRQAATLSYPSSGE